MERRVVWSNRWAACALVLFCGAAAAQKPATETVVYDFAPASPMGAGPKSGLTRDSAGDLYGTVSGGGAGNSGLVYKLGSSGEKVLYSFTGGADGRDPSAGVVFDAAGNLYGTTYYGGVTGIDNGYGLGVVFKLDPSGRETVLHSFTGVADGSNPAAGVVRDASGDLYGTTYSGGLPDCGVVYKVDIGGLETVLYTFKGRADGANPVAGLILDEDGNLYGTAESGGAFGYGVVFKLDPAGKETVLYSFKGGDADGANPAAGLTRDAKGNLYGTLSAGAGGGCPFGCGAVFKLDPAGHETVLYAFANGGGSKPSAGVVLDKAGNIYGTTTGGNPDNPDVFYKIDPAGQETVLYTFPANASGYTQSGQLLYAGGEFYGTTYQGGASGAGEVYKIDTAGNETTIYSFPLGTNGYSPQSGVTRDASGNLYGTTRSGGTKGAGTVYKVDPSGTGTVLYSFTGGADGGQPMAGVIFDASGNLYGTTAAGGDAYQGVVYQVNTSGQETVLHSFTGTDGGNAQGGLTFDAAGNLYGTTYNGGPDGMGVVFKLDTAGQETVLYGFSGGDGANPNGDLVFDAAGNLYGTAAGGGPNDGNAGEGIVFKVDAQGEETMLYSFTGWADGGVPQGGVVLDSSGNAYGVAAYGGSDDAGVVFKVDAAGRETVLYNFTGGADGGTPYGGLIRGPEGNLYGTCSRGGDSNAGAVFELGTAGHETVFYSFTGGADGAYPATGVVADNKGGLLGTTPLGGTKSGGVVFKLETAAARK
jgi:uncharacterized repeat protein (TIGR03803 family)